MLLSARSSTVLLIVTCFTCSALAVPSRSDDMEEPNATDSTTNFTYAKTEAFRDTSVDNADPFSMRESTTSHGTSVYDNIDLTSTTESNTTQDTSFYDSIETTSTAESATTHDTSLADKGDFTFTSESTTTQDTFFYDHIDLTSTTEVNVMDTATTEYPLLNNDSRKNENVTPPERQHIDDSYDTMQDDFRDNVLKSIISDHVSQDLSALENVTDRHIFEWVRNTTEAHAVILVRSDVRSMLSEHESLDFAHSLFENIKFDRQFLEQLMRLSNFPLQNVAHLWNFKQLVTMDTPFLTLFRWCWTPEVEQNFIRFFFPLYEFILSTKGEAPDYRTFDDLLIKLLIDSKVLGRSFLGGPNHSSRWTWQLAMEQKAHQFGGVWTGHNFKPAHVIPKDYWL